MSNDKIYRFKFTNQINELLNNFSKLHKYTAQKEYKEKWEEFISENKEDIDNEIERLIKLGYSGDIKEKMYKSARYYFRKKSDEKKEPIKRREYKAIDREIIDNMDIHINRNINNDNYSPAKGFDNFQTLYQELLTIEIDSLKGSTDYSLQEIKQKLKKTYKNRYFQYTRNVNNN